MKCEYVKENIERYIDNDMTAEEKNEIEEHFKTCASCQAELEFAAAVRKSIKGLDMPKVPEDFLENVNKAIDNKPERRNIRSIINTRFISTIAACLIIAAVLSLNESKQLTDNMEFHDINTVSIGDTVITNSIETDIPDETSMPAAADSTDEPETNKREEKKKTSSNKETVSKSETITDMVSEDFAVSDKEGSVLPESKADESLKNEDSENSDDTENTYKENSGIDDEADMVSGIAAYKSAAVGGVGSSSGGTGRSLGVSAAAVSDVKALYADSKFLEEIRLEALKYGEETDGIYKMDRTNYELFLDYIRSVTSEYTAPEINNEYIFFSIEAK